MLKINNGIEENMLQVIFLLIINSKTKRNIPTKKIKKFNIFNLSSLCLSQTYEKTRIISYNATTIGIPRPILPVNFLSPKSSKRKKAVRPINIKNKFVLIL